MTTPSEKPLVITELTIENVKRLRAVRITPNGDSTQVIGGRNAQGKTSTLDSIEMAIGGGKAIPQEPLRRGARKGKAAVSLGAIGAPPDFMVERTFGPDGSSQLTVKNAQGVPQKSPQALLDSLCAAISFDPFAFTRLDPKKQDAILKQAIGLDFTEIDNRRSAAFAERTDAKRALKDAEALYAAMPDYSGVPKQEESVSDIAALLSGVRSAASARAVGESRVEAAERVVDNARDAVTRIETDLAAAKERLAQDTETLAARRNELFALPESGDATELEAKLKSAEATNAKVRANLAREAAAKKLSALEDRVKSLTAAIDAADDEKQKKLEAAAFPVPGLGFTETGPTLNGVPLEQASSAEQLRVSVAIGLALNPRLRVLLIREGSLLDDDSMRMLAEIASEAGAQLWVEKVSSTGEGCSVVISDGEVQGAASAAE
jgi:hypothetical protein